MDPRLPQRATSASSCRCSSFRSRWAALASSTILRALLRRGKAKTG